MGSALRIAASKPRNVGETIKLTVAYSTTVDSTALQWLDKECVVCFPPTGPDRAT